MSIFGSYSRYYNLIYQDKDYQAEADHIDRLIQKHKLGAKTLLDLGCGTGLHASLLAKMGYSVYGIDLSKEMIAQANKKKIEENLVYLEGDIRSIRLNTIFDVVISMFHVISYQTTNDDILNAFRTAYEHLPVGGLFIFDSWYGPAVLNLQPEVRIKRLRSDDLEITRIAEPILYSNQNIVLVNYHIFVRDINTGKIEEIFETHKMRYLFKPEIEMALLHTGFIMKSFNVAFSEDMPSEKTWNVFFVAVKSK